MPERPATWTDARLRGTRFGPVRWFARVDSTNRLLLADAARGAPEGTVAVADEQTAGRGRLGRSWHAPRGASLLASVLLRPGVTPAQRPLLTLAAAVAACDAVGALAAIDAGVKWPNDVVVGDRKLAGILAEAAGDAVVVGMGLNVHWDAFPPDLAATATACNLCASRPVAREDVLEAWLRAFDVHLARLGEVVREAARRSATLGRRVRVQVAGEAFEGHAVDLDPDGRLVVRRDDGASVAVAAADVFHLRPAGGPGEGPGRRAAGPGEGPG
jgi:BirA family biotin operon repressor/biotin-[acetyl-CoA-carboxylase] ligase